MEPAVHKTELKLSSSFVIDSYLIHSVELLKILQGKKILAHGLRLEIIVTYYKAVFRNICDT